MCHDIRSEAQVTQTTVTSSASWSCVQGIYPLARLCAERCLTHLAENYTQQVMTADCSLSLLLLCLAVKRSVSRSRTGGSVTAAPRRSFVLVSYLLKRLVNIYINKKVFIHCCLLVVIYDTPSLPSPPLPNKKGWKYFSIYLNKTKLCAMFHYYYSFQVTKGQTEFVYTKCLKLWLCLSLNKKHVFWFLLKSFGSFCSFIIN